MIKCAGGRMFAGVLAGGWPPVATLADHLLGREHALPLRPATDREVWGPGGTVDRCTVETIHAVAAGERGTPWPGATARAYARYHTDGDRTEYEAAVSGRQQRLSRCAVMAAYTLEPSWAHEVADGVIVLYEQSSWCWPAHDDTFTRHGSVLPTVTDLYLDLGAGEVGGHLVHLGVPDGVPVDLTPRELTDPMLRDVWGERIIRLDLTVTAPAGTLTIRITEAPDD